MNLTSPQIFPQRGGNFNIAKNFFCNGNKSDNPKIKVLKQDVISFNGKVKTFSIDPDFDDLVKQRNIDTNMIQYIERVKAKSSLKNNKTGGKKVLIMGSDHLGFGVMLDSMLQNIKSNKPIDIKMALPRKDSENTASRLAPIYKFNGTVIKNTLTNKENFIELSADDFVPQWNEKKFNDSIKKSNTIIVTLPDEPSARKEIFDRIGSNKLDNKTVILMPGGEGGVIEAARKISESNSNVTVGLVETAPYGCRMNGILDAKRKSLVDVAVIPKSKIDNVLQTLDKVFPLKKNNEKVIKFNPVSPLDIILGGENYIYHCAVVLNSDNLLKSMKKVDRKAEYPKQLERESNEAFEKRINSSYNHYIEGITPEIANLMEGLDRERMAIAKALDCKAESISEALNRHYGIGKYEKYYDAFQACKNVYSSRPPTADKLASHRYITEDLASTKVIMRLGQIAGVDTPVTNKAFEVFCWNANEIKTPKDKLVGYEDAIKKLPDSKEGLIRYLENPAAFKNTGSINSLFNAGDILKRATKPVGVLLKMVPYRKFTPNDGLNKNPA